MSEDITNYKKLYEDLEEENRVLRAGLTDLDFSLLIAWMRDPSRIRSTQAFTSGAVRDAARAFEMYLFLKETK